MKWIEFLKKNFVIKIHFIQAFLEKKNNNKFFFNLRGLIKFQLKELGFKKIHSINLDTYSNKSLFYSHRRSVHKQKNTTGRLINVISLT